MLTLTQDLSAMPQGSVCMHLQVSWGFNSTELRQALSSSGFLTSLTVALGAQISDYDLQLLAASCPHLEHLKLSFQHVSDAGGLELSQTVGHLSHV